MKLLKNIFISLLTAIITMATVYGAYEFDFTEAGLDFDEAFELYHSEMLKHFNDKFERLNILVKGNSKFFDDQKFKRPPGIKHADEDLAKIVKICGEENVSTYCVSMGALKIYSDYLKSLNLIEKQLSTPEEYDTVLELLERTEERNQKIKQEIQHAKETMEAAVSAYHDLRLAYPMHKKYQDVIRELTKYKLALKDIKNEVSQFPGKFNDASSASCK